MALSVRHKKILRLIFVLWIANDTIFQGTIALKVVDMITDAHSNFTLPCPGVASQTIVSALQWLFGTKKIMEFAHQITTVWENRDRIDLLIESMGLSFRPVFASDSGIYTCLINNRPSPETVINLIVRDVPGAPSRPLISEFSSRSANFSWAPPPHSHTPITHYMIQTRNGEKSDWKEGYKTKDNSTFFHVTGLYPYSVYSFRVLAENEFGISEPGEGSYYMFTLREIPEGTPNIIDAYNTSASTICFEWTPPERRTINGEFLGYHVSYRSRKLPSSEAIERSLYLREFDSRVAFFVYPDSVHKQVLDNSSNISSATIYGLDPYTQYVVGFQVFNPQGFGPPSVFLVMTDEGEPSAPLDLNITVASSTYLLINWTAPAYENGVIGGYRVYFMVNNYTDVRTSNTPDLGFNLTDLKPYTKYKIWASAYTLKFEGLQSDPIFHRTDVGPPSMPIIVNASCQSNGSIYIEWREPREFNVSVDQYTVNYTNIEDNVSEELTLGYQELSVLIEDLDEEAIYEIYVVGWSRSEYDINTFVRGEPSEKRRIAITEDCEELDIAAFWKELSAAMIAALLTVLVATIVIVCCFICLCKHARRLLGAFRRYFYRERVDEQTPKPPVIAMEEFAEHVAGMHADGDLGFSREYEAIQQAIAPVELTTEASENPENRDKNRYLNIMSYDHTRVRFLTPLGQEPVDEYINANFIDGFEKKAAYIGTQGPLPVTFTSFWKMVWEQEVCIIVMITNLIERGRRKCDMYWPREDSELHGNVNVTLEKEDIKSTYTVRTFRVRYVKDGVFDKKKPPLTEGRVVKQFHYTNWPDHGTPEHALPILRFINKSSTSNPPEGGPIVVHCSAGVGRTGAYIVLDSMLQMVRSQKEVDVFNFLKHIRTQRNYLVQTEEQYIFIHDALVEAIQSGDTCIHQSHLESYFYKLSEGYDEEQNMPGPLMEEQHKLSTNFRASQYHFLSAKKPMNISKNGTNPVIPVEASRVHLSPKPGLEGSDYVNASWFMGYHRLHEYIVTCAPCDDSLLNYWQMMWDHSVRTIAVFIDFSEGDEVFWPVGKEIIVGETFRVRAKSEGDYDGIPYKEFALTSASGEFDWSLRKLFFPGWPKNEPPSNAFDAINRTHEWNAQFMNGPIVLVDRLGAAQAATFCVLSTIVKQIICEGYADIYTFVKLYHMCRPGCWTSSRELQYVYEAILAVCDKLPAAEIPPLVPEYSGAAALPAANGNAIGYDQDQQNNNEINVLESGVTDTELESSCSSALLSQPNTSALQENYMNGSCVCEETKINVELLDELPEEEEEEEEEEEYDFDGYPIAEDLV